jgi:hypothetical protein
LHSTPDPASRHRLELPAGRLASWAEPLDAADSLALAAAELVAAGTGVVAVVEAGRFVGGVSEATVAAALAAGLPPETPLGKLADPDWPTARPAESGATVLRLLAGSGKPAIVVVDDHGAPLGVVPASRLLADGEPPTRGRLVGGMATPFGVYLTNGVVGAGAGGWALFSTGALLFTLVAVSVYAGNLLALLAPAQAAGSQGFVWLQQAASTGIFLALLRALPLSGIHAAEHKVVHAIERGEELTPEVVSRMPRVHPRCGTNLAVGATMFLFLAGLKWTPFEELRLLAAVLVTLALWRPAGSIVQYFVTTKPPTTSQIGMGIASGKALLAKIAVSPGHASLPTRILNSGLLHIVAGSATMEFVLWGIEQALRVPPAWRVFS